jgi:hypothetical protein
MRRRAVGLVQVRIDLGRSAAPGRRGSPPWARRSPIAHLNATLPGFTQEALSAAARGASAAPLALQADAPLAMGVAQRLALSQLRGCALPASSRYHGRGSEDDDGAAAAAPRRASAQDGGAPTLAEGAARRAMRDPLAMLMAARSVPLGISLRVDKQQQEPGLEEGEGDAEEEAGTDGWRPQGMQRQQGRRRQAPRAAAAAARPAPEGAAAAGAGSAPRDPRVAAAARLGSDPARALEQLEQLLASAAAAERGALSNSGGDSWGTTTQSAAEIARRIAESNRGARRAFGAPPTRGSVLRCVCPRRVAGSRAGG